MRKRRKSKVLLVSAGAATLTIVALTGWAVGKTDSSVSQQAPSPRASSQMTTTSSQTEVAITQIQVVAPSTTPSVIVAETPAETAPAPAISGMQPAQLTAGDFSSIEGVWVNGYGQTLTFGSAGLMDGKGTIQGLKATDRGTARGSLIDAVLGGGVIEFLPVGTVFHDHVYDTEDGDVVVLDASDKQLERIWLGHDYSQIGDNASFYYRKN